MPTPRDRLAWLLSASTFLLLLTFFLPYTVEKMTYAFTRGKQRAMYETAGDKLQHVGLNDLSKAYQLVAHRVEPSVVHINVTSVSAENATSLEGTGWRHPTTGQGSGIIVDLAGHIVTNAHVILGAARIDVRLSDGRLLPATIVGTDRVTDMAVLQINASELIAAEWGDSDELEVGALVWAIGSPMGLQQSVTFGILSGKHRSFRAEPGTGVMNMLGHIRWFALPRFSADGRGRESRQQRRAPGGLARPRGRCQHGDHRGELSRNQLGDPEQYCPASLSSELSATDA